ncbi:MAG: hypothetical protein LBP87_07565 [Planctomycetaceae bacterium]|jgi:hypothetical protein|nr:hypothetical protein [Planctomycetaceae bacterium]
MKMKKVALFCAFSLVVSAFFVGCSSDGSFSFCRTGSLFPTTRAKKEVVYTTSGTGVGACDVASACNPCEPAACDPCEPVCPNPCDMSCNGVVSGRILPGPAN